MARAYEILVFFSRNCPVAAGSSEYKVAAFREERLRAPGTVFSDQLSVGLARDQYLAVFT